MDIKNMSLLHLVFCCLTIYYPSAGRIVQGIIGRNVSFSWTFNKIRNDAILIMHGGSLFHQILPVVQRELLGLGRLSVSYNMAETITVTVNIMNITVNDAGTYRVIRQWNSTELDKSIYLQTNDESMIPKIEIIRHTILNSTLALKCSVPRISTGNVSWRLNGSRIVNRGRYSLKDTLLTIRNLTAGDVYNLFQCKESDSELESDPYNIKISGPKVISFAPNITIVKEHSIVNITCITDCYPICSWTWTKLDHSSSQEKVISVETSLYIQDITRYDAGTFLCTVLNKITGISLGDVTSLEIIYGPDVIVFNTSDNIIQLDETDSITISCTAECYPQCQIVWTKPDVAALILSTEIHIFNVKSDCNYTCHATNARNDNATILNTIYVTKKSAISNYTTTGKTLEEGPKGCQAEWIAKHVKCLKPSAELNLDNVKSDNFLSKRQLQYILPGMGVIVVAAFVACLLRKIGIRIRVDRVSNNSPFIDSNGTGGDENVQTVNQSGNYWTIVSNAKGEMSTAIDSDFERHRELVGQSVAPTHYKAEQPMRPDGVDDFGELSGYLTPIHTCQAEPQKCIHPISTQYETEQSIRPGDVSVNDERDGYLNPIHSRHSELDEYIHPIHSDS